MAGLLFRMFRVDKTKVGGTMPREQLQPEMGEFRTELAMLILDNIFQADQCDAFDFDVDEAPTAQTMFMANLSSVDLIYNDAGPSYDSDFLSEVQDHDNYLDSVGEYHEDNAVQDVQSNVSSVPNDALMMIISDIHEQAAQCVSANEQNKVVNESLTAELARYKEQVKIYEKRESAMQVQSALYNGHEILKTNHIPAVVHDLEDTLELTEITRKRMLEKVKSPMCVEKKVKIAPPNYSKENYL
ncbi:hypothetical protein Tco_0328485, partial [Tanacetum coccineum]